MIYYILFIGCISGLLALEHFLPSKKHLFLWAVFFLAVFFAGFRDYVGADYSYYVNWYGTKSRDARLEFGFVAIMDVFRYFNLSYHYLFFFFSFLTCFFVFLGIRNYTDNVKLALLFFLLIPGLYINSFSIIRQYFSLAISFYAFYFLVNRKYLIYLILMFLGVAIHNTCYIVFIVFFLVYRWGHLVKPLHIVLAMGVSLIFSQLHYLEYFARYFEKTRYLYYFSIHKEPTSNLKLLVLNSVGVFVLFQFERLKNKYSYQQYLILFYFCSIVITNFFAQYIDLTRIAYYFKIFEIIVIADLIYLQAKEYRYKYFAFFFVYYLSIYIYALYTDLNDKVQFVDYKSIF